MTDSRSANLRTRIANCVKPIVTWIIELIKRAWGVLAQSAISSKKAISNWLFRLRRLLRKIEFEIIRFFALFFFVAIVVASLAPIIYLLDIALEFAGRSGLSPYSPELIILVLLTIPLLFSTVIQFCHDYRQREATFIINRYHRRYREIPYDISKYCGQLIIWWSLIFILFQVIALLTLVLPGTVPTG